MVSVLVIAELAKGHRWSWHLEPNLWMGFELWTSDWLSSMLTIVQLQWNLTQNTHCSQEPVCFTSPNSQQIKVIVV